MQLLGKGHPVVDKTTDIRTFEGAFPISGKLDVPFADWPSNIQDGIWEALDALASKVELPLQVVYAEYRTDPDVPEEAPGRHYLHVVVSEVVMADERTIDRNRVIRELPEEIRGLLN